MNTVDTCGAGSALHHDAYHIDALMYDESVRTTVTLTPQAEALVQAAMAESRRSFKDVVNDAIVAALAPTQTRAFRTQTHALGRFDPGREGFDLGPDKALALVGVLEDRELARKREMGK
ncbi:MAG: hypothetical protein FWH11_12170 [Micrococcales bacterium]|nr:hypothetical protein [Micrococcales bacterium]